MTKATKLRLVSASDEAPDDAKLIAQCSKYVMSSAAYNAAYDADPDPNNVNAERVCSRPYSKARAALAALSSMEATSAHGLNAKCRTVPALLRDFDHMPKEVAAFLESFAADVRAWTAPACEAAAKKATEKAAVQS